VSAHLKILIVLLLINLKGEKGLKWTMLGYLLLPPLIQTKMKKELVKIIRDIEKEEKVKVLFLIESGSRGWGWESEDSDYDIRGVFIQDYLKFTEIKEQIDREKGDLDITLWDLRKFFRLMVKSNPSVWEWLSSDIIYLENPLRRKLKRIFLKNFSEYSLKKHYVSMAKQNFDKYINNEKENANLKKYVYVLRSVACVTWIEKYKTPPPKNYKKILKLFPKYVKDFFEKVVKDKRKSENLVGPRNKKVENFIESYFDKNFDKDGSTFKAGKLNKLFKNIIK